MKKIFILILFVHIVATTFAQSDVDNMIKYWHYRERLKYFIFPGERQGESEVLGIRNNSGDGTVYHTDTLHKIGTNGDMSISFGFDEDTSFNHIGPIGNDRGALFQILRLTNRELSIEKNIYKIELKKE